jgi:hypothetical protein
MVSQAWLAFRSNWGRNYGWLVYYHGMEIAELTNWRRIYHENSREKSVETYQISWKECDHIPQTYRRTNEAIEGLVVGRLVGRSIELHTEHFWQRVCFENKGIFRQVLGTDVRIRINERTCSGLPTTLVTDALQLAPANSLERWLWDFSASDS